MVAGHVMPFDAVAVDIVQDGQALVGSLGLGNAGVAGGGAPVAGAGEDGSLLAVLPDQGTSAKDYLLLHSFKIFFSKF